MKEFTPVEDKAWESQMNKAFDEFYRDYQPGQKKFKKVTNRQPKKKRRK